MGAVVTDALARVSVTWSAGPTLRPAMRARQRCPGRGEFDRTAVAQMSAVLATPPAEMMAVAVDAAGIGASPSRGAPRLVRWRG
jgi:hypothetical protein